MIEDNPGDVDLVRELLADVPTHDFDIEYCPHLETGLATLRSTPFDLLIADLSLPDATPAQTLARIREARDSAAVVVLSSSSDAYLRSNALRAGAQEYLVKGEPATLVLGRCLVAAIERHRGQAVRRQLESWISLTPDAVVVASPSGVVHFINVAATELFGRSAEELLHESFCFSLVEGSSTEVEILRGDELRHGEMRVVPIDWHGEPAVLATIRDITERRRAEAQLAATDRLVTVGTLVASITHEINNPMAAMVVNLELASREAARHPALEELQQLLSDIREAADRVRAISSDLRMLSRSTHARTEWVNLQRVIDMTLRLAAHELRHRTQVVVDLEADTPLFRANEQHIGQLLLNLVVNAAQAIGDGRLHDARVTISARTSARGELELRVSDNGPGMTTEAKRNLFKPFFTTKPASQGTGLGLSICRRIVESYGGDLRVESELGVGTTFIVTLPLAAPSLPPPRPSSPPPPATRRARILVIDDEVLIGQAVLRALRSQHDVEVAHSAEAGWTMLRQNAAYDVIFCDVTMPEMMGTELFERVERELPEAARRFVFFSGGAFSQHARDVLERVKNEKLTKPLNIAELTSLISRVLSAPHA